MLNKEKNYQHLIEKFPLRPIHNDHILDHAHQIAEPLFNKLDQLAPDEYDYLEVLCMLIKEYENKAHPLIYKKESPNAMLRYLMDCNNMKQADLAKVLSISSGRASEIVNGIRELSKTQITSLANYFKVTTDLFMPISQREINAVAESTAVYKDRKRRTLKK